MGTPPEQTDRYFAANLRMIRERRGISQVTIAQEMAARGFPWRQQTVTRIESGLRMVRLGEARAVAEILRVTLDRLTWSGAEVNEAAYVGQAADVLRGSWHEAALAVERLLAAVSGAKHVLAERRDSKYQRTRDACEELEADLVDFSLKTAVDEGIARSRGTRGDSGEDGAP